MRQKLRPVVLLTEIDDAVRLHSHAETRTDRNVMVKRLLSGRTCCPVLAARSEDEESKSTNRQKPVTLHNFASD